MSENNDNCAPILEIGMNLEKRYVSVCWENNKKNKETIKKIRKLYEFN